MQSWQIYAYAHKVLPKGFLEKLYSRSPRLVYMWAADPATTDSNERNSIDRLRILLRELDLAGYGHVAHAAIDLMAAPLGGRFEPFPEPDGGRKCVDGEAADAAVALGRLIESCRAAIEDGHTEADELDAILERFRDTRKQLDELMDAARTAGVKGKKR